MVPGVEKINDAKIPVVNVTDRSAGGKFVAFVGADDYSLGLETARYLLKTLGGKGNFVIIEGVKGVLTSIDRVRGFNDALKENPGAKLLASQPGNYQRLQALQVMENLMQSNTRSTACWLPTMRWRSARSRRSKVPIARPRSSASMAPRRRSTRSSPGRCWRAATIMASCRDASA
jgi:hypothetical protein